MTLLLKNPLYILPFADDLINLASPSYAASEESLILYPSVGFIIEFRLSILRVKSMIDRVDLPKSC